MPKHLLLIWISFFSYYGYSQKTATIDSISSEDLKEINRLINCSDEYYYSGNYVQSLSYNVSLLEKALEINSNKYISKAYGFLGYDYLELNDTTLAKESFKKQLKFAKLSNDTVAVANTYMNLANYYGSVQENWEKAWQNHKQSIILYEKAGDSSQVATAHYNTALSAMRSNRFDMAKIQLDILKQYADYLNAANTLYAKIIWGLYYVSIEEYKTADTYFLEIINSTNAEKQPIELQNAYKEYSNSLFLQKRYEDAFIARKNYEEIFIKGVEKIQKSNSEEITATYRVDEYKRGAEEAELRNELQAKVVENKNRLNQLLLIITIIGIIFFIALFYLFRNKIQLVKSLKQKNNDYLEAKRISDEMLETKNKFFSTVSHEIRTPLYGVVGLTNLLLEDKKLKDHREDLKSLKFSADYLLALINDVLHLNKMESKTIEEEHVNFNLHDFLKNITNSFAYMSKQNNNIITLIVDESIPKIIKGSSIRLSQILINLLGNASKFTRDGTITVNVQKVQATPDKVTLNFSIKDTGKGIPKEKQENIFNEFSQVDSQYYNYQGSGLGLSIVKRLLDLSNASISLESEVGRGSTFSFQLTFDVDQEKNNIQHSKIIDETTLANKKILIVDDNKINQMITLRILKKHKVNCGIVEDGLSAINMVKHENYDLILMDINMPDMDGYTATKNIRAFNPTIPIIALTALEVEEISNKIYDSGMNDVINKPYDISTFIKTIVKNINGDNPPYDQKLNTG